MPWLGVADNYRRHVGFNPFRTQDKGVVDVLMVVGAIVVAVALVLWAAFGG